MISSRSPNRSRGFTIVEMLLGAALLGVVLVVATEFLNSNQRVTSAQQATNDSLEDGRAAMSRIGEVVNAAAYVYPSGVTITGLTGLAGNGTAAQITTGASAVALLIPDNQGGNPKKYHGVIYYLTGRSNAKFSGDLPTLGTTQIGESVLVEARTGLSGVGAMTWNTNSNPATDLISWTGVSSIPEGVLADGIVAAESNLMDSAKYSPSAGLDDAVFNNGLRNKTPAITNVAARILGLGFQITTQVVPQGKTLSTASKTVLRGLGTGRNIPRR
jgi:prepilin-type N-terminal cleavage/methylation domain-containing protein